MQIESPQMVFNIITSAATVGWVIVGLMIKSSLGEIRLNQANDKADLVESQNEMKEQLNQKHAENVTAVAVHVAEDRQQFASIARTLNRIDDKLDRIAK